MEVKKVDISDELKKSYLDYAMDVIVDRALPDVRDGLKPVHRRVLYGMHVLGLHYTQNGRRTPTVKSARVVGDVMGKYHPHGNAAIYDAMVRMVQDFSLRYPLIKGQGNFGSIDGDAAAAERYTEVKLEKISDEILADLDKDTVDLKKNYDSSLDIPDYVLPTKLPNLLINGCSGIAVGLATNIPTHNLTECINACLALIKNPDISPMDLMEYIPGPDFPTGGIINGISGIRSAYLTGKGRVVVRCRYNVETDVATGRDTIVITEIPYSVNKAETVKFISELMSDKKIEGISSIQDVSSNDIRIEIEVKKGAYPEVVMNNLFKLTQLESSFNVNMVALVKGRPKNLTLKEILECFIDHRREVVTRRTACLLAKSRDRAHILEAFLVALDNMDEIVRIIRESNNRQDAKETLMSRGWTANVCAELLQRFGDNCRPISLAKEFGYRDGVYYLTEAQTEKILDMRLSQLVKIAKEDIIDEYTQLNSDILDYLHILNSAVRLHEVICEELEEIRDKYGDERRTEIQEAANEIIYEDLITPHDVVVTLSHRGYIKYQDLDLYRTAHRGTRGRKASVLKDEDYSEIMTIANTHDNLLLFSNLGRVYRTKVYQLPECNKSSGVGRPVVNILNLDEEEQIKIIYPVKEFDDNHYMFFATKLGRCKKTRLSEYTSITKAGKIALNLLPGDELVGIAVTTGEDDIMLFTAGGYVLRTNEKISKAQEEIELRRALLSEEDELMDNEADEDITDDQNSAEEDGDESESEGGNRDENFRPTGRQTSGVRGIKLSKGDEVVSLVVPQKDAGSIVIVYSNGKGFRTSLDNFVIRAKRYSKGVLVGILEGDDRISAALQVGDNDELALITSASVFNKVAVSEVRICGRRAKGVRILRLDDGTSITSVEKIIKCNEDQNDNTVVKELTSISLNPEEEEQIQDENPDSSDEI